MTWDLRLGDCLDPVTGLASLPDKSIDVVITDPPYGESIYATYSRVGSTPKERKLGASSDLRRMDAWEGIDPHAVHPLWRVGAPACQPDELPTRARV